MRLRRTLPTSLPLICLLLAFVCSWLLAYLLIGNNGVNAIFLLVVSPLFLGIAVAWIISTKNKYLISLVIGAGLLAAAGIYGYAVSITTRDDAAANAYCAHNYCHVGGIETFFLNLAFLFAIVLVLLSAAITGLIIKAYHWLRSKKQTAEHKQDAR